MPLNDMEQILKLVLKCPTRPQYYMRIKNYVDSIFQNFNWETMNEKDVKRALEIIDKAVNHFVDMRLWKEPYKGKYKNE